MNRLLPVMTLVGCLVTAPWIAAAEPAATQTTTPTKAQVEALLTKAQDWLLAQQQPDGAFLPGKQFVVGVTAMSVEVLARPPLAIGKDCLLYTSDAADE